MRCGTATRVTPWHTDRGSVALGYASTEQGPQAHDFSLRSRAFPLPGGVATRMFVSPSYYDVSVAYRSAKYHYVENQKQAT
jgi:hypothetical protein